MDIRRLKGLAASGASRGVEIAAVTKRFGAFLAVDGATLSIAAGKFMTLLGPSGSGKTTLLQMVAGLLTPDEGLIRIGDEDVTVLAPHQREIGMVFQNYALFPHLSIFENIAFPLRLRHVPERELRERVTLALEMINLPHVAERRISELSGGQQQRIALARALVYRPGVLLMDEPLGALDRKLRDQMKFEIKLLQRQLGTTVIYVTHDQDEALTMSDEIAVMDGGRIVQVDTPHRLYSKPATRFAADFIGDSNLIPGTFRASEGTAVVETVHGLLRCQPAERPCAAGAPAWILVRPEHARILGRDESGAAAIDAVVVQAVFRGEFTELTLQLGDGSLFRLKSPGAGPAVEADQPVRVGWSETDAVLVHDTAGTAA